MVFGRWHDIALHMVLRGPPVHALNLSTPETLRLVLADGSHVLCCTCQVKRRAEQTMATQLPIMEREWEGNPAQG